MIGTGNVNLADVAGAIPYDDSVAPAFNATNVQSAIDTLKTQLAGGIINYNVTGTSSFSTTSAADTMITGQTVTPQSGTYAVIWSANCSNTGSGVNNTFSIYKNGTLIADSPRQSTSGAGSHLLVGFTQTVVQVNGSQAIDIRCATSGSLTITGRTILIFRLGP